MADATRPLRILYAAGPGNVIGTYRHWRDGRDDPSQVHVTYSSQFFEQCRRLEARALVISSCPSKARLDDDSFSIRHRPIPFRRRGGVLYHLGQIWYGLRLLATAARFRPHVAVVSEGTTHWFMIIPLRWLRVQIVPTVHCVPWPKFGELTGTRRWVLRRGRRLFTHHVAAMLAASDDIVDQFRQLSDRPLRPAVRFLPMFRRELFADIPPPDHAKRPFRVFFAGRVEANKGVFDLLEIARRFHQNGRHDVEFDICGTGSSLEQLRTEAGASPCHDRFHIHGHCDHSRMKELYGRSHAVIVPTRTDFVEGFNQVVVESVLAGRPVITSAVCPALAFVESAAIEVAPDSVDEYLDAISRLCDDRVLYEEKRANCHAVSEQFYDERRSWGAALRSVLLALQHGEEPTPVQWQPVNGSTP